MHENNMDNMDEKTCGCDCELCKAGKHHECQSGMCQWHDKDTEEKSEE